MKVITALILMNTNEKGKTMEGDHEYFTHFLKKWSNNNNYNYLF